MGTGVLERRRKRKEKGARGGATEKPCSPPVHRWAAPIVAGLLLLLAAIAFVDFRWRAFPGAMRDPGANVLLITVDTLRADALGCYGNTHAATPWMDRLAAAGTRFAVARAHNVVTLPSHANILSGRYPLAHGVRDNSGFRFPSGLDTLATMLKARGYRTAAFVSAFPVASRFGLGRGFDLYDDSFVDATAGQPFLVQERRGRDTVARATRWIEGAGSGQPWLAWVHLFEPHYPYTPPEPFATRFGPDLYGGEVAAADAALAPLLEPILTGRPEHRTLIVLTGDHGESLGEHGEATHGIFGYEALLRVPLIFCDSRRPVPHVVQDPVRHVDVLPTILDALAVPIPADLDGESLLPLVEGQRRRAQATYFEALSSTLGRGWAPLYGVVRDRFKFVDVPIPELYDLTADPHERHNIAEMQPARLQEMRALLSQLRRTDRGPAQQTESAETRARLRSLGYISGSAPLAGRFSEEDDPKRLIALDATLQDVLTLHAAGHLDAAAARCHELIRARPGMAVSYLYLAQVERERGDLDAAVRALRQAVAITPNDTVAVALLGASLTEAGQPAKARRVLEAHDAGPGADDQIVVAHALALARLGQFADALVLLERAQHEQPNAMLLVELGTVHMMAGDTIEARLAFENALALNANVARAHSSLGVIAASSGRPEEAAAHWKQAVALDPREYAKLLAMGTALARNGRPAAARPYLEFFATFAPPARYERDIVRAREWLAAHRTRQR